MIFIFFFPYLLFSVTCHRKDLISTTRAAERHDANVLKELCNYQNKSKQESQEQRDERLQQNITRTRAARNRVLDRQRQRISRSLTRASFVRLAFEYAPDINYSAHSKIAIGGMDKVCQYYQALKFRNEAAGMCYTSGKVVLPPLPAPPEPYYPFLLAIQMIPNYFCVRYANLILASK